MPLKPCSRWGKPHPTLTDKDDEIDQQAVDHRNDEGHACGPDEVGDLDYGQMGVLAVAEEPPVEPAHRKAVQAFHADHENRQRQEHRQALRPAETHRRRQ